MRGLHSHLREYRKIVSIDHSEYLANSWGNSCWCEYRKNRGEIFMYWFRGIFLSPRASPRRTPKTSGRFPFCDLSLHYQRTSQRFSEVLSGTLSEEDIIFSEALGPVAPHLVAPYSFSKQLPGLPKEKGQ